jgi:hypothetical protein
MPFKSRYFAFRGLVASPFFIHAGEMPNAAWFFIELYHFMEPRSGGRPAF